MSAHRFEGGCHCGNLSFVFEASAGLDVIGLRADQCTFCLAHRNRTTSDPKGAMRIVMREPSELSRYRFGLGITDYLLCAKCGIYVGAVMPDDGRQIGIVNVNALDIRDTFDPAPPLHQYDGEDEARRRARRRKFWMPAAVIA